MLDLTFAEQVKIILSRKGMTIKELAEMIEEKTGKKMSRQNLTQRLGRDNFQEQDMRMIADILGCSFQLSILGDARQPEHAGEETGGVTEAELQRLEKKKEKKRRRSAERDITIGELAKMSEHLDELSAAAPEPEESIVLEETGQEAVPVEEPEPETEEQKPEEVFEPEAAAEAPAEPEAQPARKARGSWRDFFQRRPRKQEEPAGDEMIPEEPAETTADKEEVPEAEMDPEIPEEPDTEAVDAAGDEEEDLEKGDINPYTGHEYESNTVRMHPNRIGYVQVYDRSSHQWTDMTEWAFLGYQERKKALLGEDYEPPIYLD